MKKKILALALCGAMCLSLAACQVNKSTGGGSKSDASAGSQQQSADLWDADGNILFKGSSNNIELGTPAKVQTPAEILKDFQYTERILYGSFSNAEAGKNGENFQSTVSYTNYDGKYPALCNLEYAEEMSILPYKIDAGYANISDSLKYDYSHEWMSVYFRKNRTSSGSTKNDYVSVTCAYEIKDNKKLILYPLKDANYQKDESGNFFVKYWLYTTPIEYDFSYDGTCLVLSKNGEKVTLDSTLDNSLKPYIFTTARVSKGSDMIDEISSISLSASPTSSRYSISVNHNDTNNNTPIAKYNKNGLFTMTYVRTKSDDTQEITTHQFVLFYQNDHGLVLTDGEKNYYYQSTVSSEYKSDTNYSFMDMTKFVSDDDKSKSDNLSGDKMTAIAEKNNDLTNDLAKAFTDEGLTVVVDKATGEMRLDAQVIFGGDSAVLSDEGKSVIQKTMRAYTKTIYDEKYKDFVSTTYVEGHTAPIDGSTYESGLPLSQERAEVVKNYILSDECGIDKAYLTDLEKSLVAVGYSNSRPVKDAEGNVDLDASRRVSIHYMINLDSVSS